MGIIIIIEFISIFKVQLNKYQNNDIYSFLIDYLHQKYEDLI